MALVGWKFGGNLDNVVPFGWRHMELEVEEGGRRTDVTFDGHIAGVLFGF